MILIQITNQIELIRQRKGNFAATIAPFIADIEAEVEREVIAQIRRQFAEHGIEASILSVGGINLRQVTLANNWPVNEAYPDLDELEPDTPDMDTPDLPQKDVPDMPEDGLPYD